MNVGVWWLCTFSMQILNFMSPWRHDVLGRDSIAVNRHHGNPYKEKNLIGDILQFQSITIMADMCWWRRWEFDILILRHQEVNYVPHESSLEHGRPQSPLPARHTSSSNATLISPNLYLLILLLPVVSLKQSWSEIIGRDGVICSSWCPHKKRKSIVQNNKFCIIHIYSCMCIYICIMLIVIVLIMLRYGNSWCV